MGVGRPLLDHMREPDVPFKTGRRSDLYLCAQRTPPTKEKMDYTVLHTFFARRSRSFFPIAPSARVERVAAGTPLRQKEGL